MLSVAALLLLTLSSCARGGHWQFQRMTSDELAGLRVRARGALTGALASYVRHAFPADELRPVSCGSADPFGSYAATLVDALDALLVVGEEELFERAARLALSPAVRFDRDRNVSVFETNIRVVGGLLSAHLLSEERALLTPAERLALLDRARDVAERLLPAFDTRTGIPYGTVNLARGVPPGETPVTSLAGAGTFAMEFGVLTALTGDARFDAAARRAVRALWQRRSALGLLGNHIDSASGQWVATDTSTGAAGDSFYEYMLKASVLLNDAEYQDVFLGSYAAVMRHARTGPWYVTAAMASGEKTSSSLDSLSAFWPGMQVLHGHFIDAERSFISMHNVWSRFGALPESFNFALRKVERGRGGYPLRPELIESCYMLSTVTSPIQALLHFQEYGRQFMDAIEHYCSAPCGYAGLSDVVTHEQEDQMHSYFIAETMKYLYLLLDQDNWVRRGNYIFTTEGHVFPLQYRFMKRSAINPAKMIQCPAAAVYVAPPESAEEGATAAENSANATENSANNSAAEEGRADDAPEHAPESAKEEEAPPRPEDEVVMEEAPKKEL